MLKLKNLTFTAKGTDISGKTKLKTIIDNINFTFEKGKFYAITDRTAAVKLQWQNL